MSYRLIDANDLNGKISDKDYEVVLNAPCIYADLPNGLDNEHYEIFKWIPVKVKEPPLGERVLTTNIVGLIQEARLVCFNGFLERDGCGWVTSHKLRHDIDYIKAWMPLPEPYKEGE